MSEHPWHETEEGKKELLDLWNGIFWVKPDSDPVRKDESCSICKNELVACVCMEEDDKI